MQSFPYLSFMQVGATIIFLELGEKSYSIFEFVSLKRFIFPHGADFSNGTYKENE